jgi:hypothetical protein
MTRLITKRSLRPLEKRIAERMEEIRKAKEAKKEEL